MNAFLRFLDTDIQNNPQKTRPFNIQHSTFNIQHSTFNIQHSTRKETCHWHGRQH
ncbi:putative regulator PrlF [Shigella sonnei]|nr:putative regulator PrlF [Shigella sonnei]CSE83274.1 putative regulator PrlF [Shigella sonnei]CSF84263.1 putative regulator PrlF [Shigella sonnei]CSF85164.1 putative regulator PrlF [Shigella sonnei]CSG15538.1 putative regulator PrlF [Shigella sonnei]